MDSFKGISFQIFDLIYGPFLETDWTETTPFHSHLSLFYKRHVSCPTLILLACIALSIETLRGTEQRNYEIGVWEPSNQGTFTRLPFSTFFFTCLNLLLETGHMGPLSYAKE